MEKKHFIFTKYVNNIQTHVNMAKSWSFIILKRYKKYSLQEFKPYVL